MARSHPVKAPALLLEFLFAEWPEAKKNTVKDWLKSKSVYVNGEAISQFDHPLAVGDTVSIGAPQSAGKIGAGIKLVYEDDALIVIDKPVGLLSMASESEREQTAYALVGDYLRAGQSRSKAHVLVVHRLDRETSGLMVFAKTSEAQRALEANWSHNEKHYVAVVEGAPPREQGLMHSFLDESQVHRVVSAPRGPNTREAKTHYRVLKRSARYSLVELRLETGRRHQIRVQLSDLGCPCVGDEKYGAQSNPAKRLGLHSCLLSFDHPLTGERVRFESPLPEVLARLL